MPSREVTDRPAVRAILLDDSDRVLLLRIVADDDGFLLWLTPGGGLEPGEDAETALRRELFEEVGLANVTIGPCVWTRSHEHCWQGKWWRAHDRFHVVRIRANDVGEGAPEAHEVNAVRRWFTMDELRSLDEDVTPQRLADLLEMLLRNGAPPHPIDAGV